MNMFRSLRFRLPAFFLAGAVLAGLISTLIALGLFQDYTEDRLVAELRREARGLSSLYAEQAIRAQDTDRPYYVSPSRLEDASGSNLFYVGLRIVFPGTTGLQTLPLNTVAWKDGKPKVFEFTAPNASREYLAVAHPVRVEGRVFGALVAAKPKAELRERWTTLIERLTLAGFFGIVVAGALAWYLSRRITEPVQKLSRAADNIAGGVYEVPEINASGEIGQLAERFREMAARLQEAEELERNFLMTVSHELRTPLNVIAHEAGRLERLVGDVLDLAKLDTRRFTLLHEEVDMGHLLERAYNAFAEEARRRDIDYRQDISARPVIVADGDRVLQIISNLLSNAFRWAHGGRIRLESAPGEGARFELVLPVTPRNDGA